MNKRITAVRKHFQLNMKDFGSNLGVSAAAISRIEAGERNVTDQMIKSICKAYNVNEQWLRNGTGEMIALPEDEIAAIVADILDNENSEFYKMILDLARIYHDLDPKSRQVLEDVAKKLVEDKKQP